MGVRAAAEVQALRIVEHLGVAVGRPQQEHDQVSRRDDRPPDLEVFQRHPLHHLHGTVVAEQLLDRPLHGDIPRAQSRQGVGLAQEGEQAVGDEVGRRLVAGE